LLFDLYVVFIFILYYGLLVNTITTLSIFNYLHKFDGRVVKPIAEAMGFTTHWIRSKSLKILYSFTAIPVLSDIQPLQISYVLLHSDVPDLRHSNVHRMLPEGN